MKMVLLFFLFASSFFARESVTRYNVYATLFGHVGYCDVFIKENGSAYEVKAIAQTIGATALLLKKRVEIFESRGIIEDGRYIPNIFIKTKKTTKKNKCANLYI